MSTPRLIKHDSPAGPYWYHPDHEDCQDGKVLWELEEGMSCPECDKGFLLYPAVENCSCHIAPPCSQCVDNRLKCTECGYEPEPKKK